MERDLSLMEPRLRLTRMTARDVSLWIDDDDGILDLIVDDVLTGWTKIWVNSGEATDLRDFWNQYANQVEHGPPGGDNEFRAEFCADRGRTDIDNYYRSVWLAHAAALRSLSSPDPTATHSQPSPALDVESES